MGIAGSTTRHLGIAGELLSFFWRNGRGWLVPILICLLLCGALLFAATNPVTAPFIYSMF